MKRDNEAYWKKCLSNADECLGEADKKFWLETEPIIIEVFNELKQNNRIEVVYAPIASRHLVNIVLNRNQMVVNYNVFMKVIDTAESGYQFFEKNADYGFTEQTTIHMLTEFAVMLSITDIECFKSILLFQLRDIDQ